MGIFKRNKQDEFESLHNNDLFGDDDDILIPRSQRDTGVHRVGQGGTSAPHALTASEVSEGRAEDIPMEHRPQPDSVYKRMKERESAAVTGIEDDYVPSWAVPSKPEAAPDISGSVLSGSTSAEAQPEAVVKEPAPTHTEPVRAKAEEPKEAPRSSNMDDFLERCRMAVEKASGEEQGGEEQSGEPEKTGTLEPAVAARVERSAEQPAPARSVDDIIRMLRKETPDGRADKATNGVGAAVEEPVSESREAEPAAPSSSAETEDTPSADAPREVKVEVEVIPTDSASEIMHTVESPRHDSDGDVRIYGKIVRGAVIQHTPEGDVEASEFIRAPKVSQDTIVAEDKTVMFGDLGDIISKKADDDMGAPSADYDDDEFDDEDDFDRPYYETEDPELQDIDDYRSLSDAARLRTEHSAQKAKHKTVAVFTSVITVLLLSTAAGVASFLPQATVALIDIILLLAALIMNWDIFADLKKLFRMRPSYDSCTALAASLVLLQNILSHFVFDGKFCGLGAAAAVLLTVNRYAKLMKASRILKGLEFIANSEPKRAVVSVGGNNAKVIASGAVEGESLVLCDRETVNVKDYLKNCGYDSPFDQRVKVLFIVVAALAAAAGVIIGLVSGFGTGFSAVGTLLCLMFPASAALTCELPMYLASKRAEKYGAMMAGYKGAYELNLANVAAVSSSDLFPEGSVKLYNMKTLGQNEMGHTLVCAAAVSEAANSPLSGIFKGIVGNVEGGLPKVNGVQYEDKMGISGWIGEETILIGNRNLMQGHNIAVPPASVDQKILKAGYFPVYISVGGVPCLLFLVKYETDPIVARELQLLCNTGMTVVVDPKDPNTTDAMICDYFGLPNDAIKVMSHNGRVSYERVAAPTDSASAPAAFSKDICGFFSSITSAIRLGGIYSVLTAVFIIAAVLGTVLTVYLSLTGKASLVNPLTVAGFQLLFTVISTIIAKIKSL